MAVETTSKTPIFPPELWIDVLEEFVAEPKLELPTVQDPTDYTTLARIAGTSSTFHELALPLMHRHVVLSNEGPSPAVPRLQAFLELVSRRPEATTWIRTLALGVKLPNPQHPIYPLLQILLGPLLCTCTRLQTLFFSFMKVPDEVFLALPGLTRLQHLEFAWTMFQSPSQSLHMPGSLTHFAFSEPETMPLIGRDPAIFTSLLSTSPNLEILEVMGAAGCDALELALAAGHKFTRVTTLRVHPKAVQGLGDLLITRPEAFKNLVSVSGPLRFLSCAQEGRQLSEIVVNGRDAKVPSGTLIAELQKNKHIRKFEVRRMEWSDDFQQKLAGVFPELEELSLLETFGRWCDWVKLHFCEDVKRLPRIRHISYSTILSMYDFTIPEDLEWQRIALNKVIEEGADCLRSVSFGFTVWKRDHGGEWRIVSTKAR